MPTKEEIEQKYFHATSGSGISPADRQRMELGSAYAANKGGGAANSDQDDIFSNEGGDNGGQSSN